MKFVSSLLVIIFLVNYFTITPASATLTKKLAETKQQVLSQQQQHETVKGPSTDAYNQAVQQGNFEEAVKILNSMWLFEMLWAIDGTSGDNRAKVLEKVPDSPTYKERTTWAFSVVQTQSRVNPPKPDLEPQLKDVDSYLQQKKQGVNPTNPTPTNPTPTNPTPTNPTPSNNAACATAVGSNNPFTYSGVVDSAKLPNFDKLKVGDVCWPLRRADTRSPVKLCSRVQAGSWGMYRKCPEKSQIGCTKCHTGHDIMTTGRGEVVAIADGKLIKSWNDLYKYDPNKPLKDQNSKSWVTDGCKGSDGGWWFDENEVKHPGVFTDHPRPAGTVMIYHPSINAVVNYGEINLDDVRIHSMTEVKQGQVLGRATFCGMLHFELYQANVKGNIRWYPTPNPTTDPNDFNDCRKHPPAGVYDPRPLLSLANLMDCPDLNAAPANPNPANPNPANPDPVNPPTNPTNPTPSPAPTPAPATADNNTGIWNTLRNGFANLFGG